MNQPVSEPPIQVTQPQRTQTPVSKVPLSSAQLTRFAFNRRTPSTRNDNNVHKFHNSLRFNAIAIPASLAVGSLLWMGNGKMFAWAFSMPFHELGHAVPAWFAGIPALPIPYGFCWVGETRTSTLVFVFISLWTIGIGLALRYRSKILFVMFSIFLLTQLRLTFFTPIERVREIWIAFGSGGEIVFGAFLVGAFTYKLPQQIRWDFWRFFSLIIGAVLFATSALKWSDIHRGTYPMPWGSAMSNNAGDGDFEKLRDLFGWTQQSITQFHLKLVKNGFVWIGVHYVLRILLSNKIDSNRKKSNQKFGSISSVAPKI